LNINLSKENEYGPLNTFLNKGSVTCQGASGSEKAYILAQAYQKQNRPYLVITPSRKETELFIQDLHFFSRDKSIPVCSFPSYNMMPYKSVSYHNEISSSRIGLLYSLISDVKNPVVVTDVAGIMQKLIPSKILNEFAELIMVQEETDMDLFISKLISGGYTRVSLVEETGDFSVRGGIVDVYPPSFEDPVRLEFFGDTVDSIRYFSPVTQRKKGSADEIIILPCKEAILEKKNLTDVVTRLRKKISDLGLPVTTGRDIIDRIKTDGIYSGIESLLSLIYPSLETLFDYMPDNTVFAFSNRQSCDLKAQVLLEKVLKDYDYAKKEKKLVVEPEMLYLDWTAVVTEIKSKRSLSFRQLDLSGKETKQDNQVWHIDIKDNLELKSSLLNYNKTENLLLPLAEWIEENRKNKRLTLIVCRSDSQLDRIYQLMLPYGIDAARIEQLPVINRFKGRVCLCTGNISSGFTWQDEFLSLVTDEEIFRGKKKRKIQRKESVKSTLLNLSELKDGDIVVHEDFGLGRYGGLTKLEFGGLTNDFALITYRDEDKLYLPVERLSVIQKYLGIDGYSPILDKMGGVTWEKAKEKAKKAVEKIAGELLKLYAERKVVKGHSFSQSDRYFQDFEAAFPYEETPDQLAAIEHVLSDMEKNTPMDRLVCGDVGYGKTEVALRASFKAVSDSKQVAILVPTTVLAEQHLKTFRERYKNYPVEIAGLSRFRSRKEQTEIVNKISEGTIDIVIGTHRIFQSDVKFRELGLVVIDEEQRFGVKHKERLKKMRSTVDVLTLTATPIPRTLHLSMMGLRDICIITTPPEQRQPIVSYLSEYDDNIVKDGIQKELSRNGQMFFVHNNVKTIWKMADKLQKLVPEMKVGVAHGQLSEKELEKAMFQFIDKEIDLLVCTTIIESGLDIPAANTMFINRADRFGLAQIYQLRGRIGRGDEQAYAYLFIPEESLLGKDALKRLKVLMEHSDLGSGFQIAMSDLQIRGGGSVLGASQSGHIAAVGYDMFLKLMDNAISELKGESVQEKLEPEININVSAFLPEHYIQDIDQRLTVYRRLAKMRKLSEIGDLREELVDRYGKIPEEGIAMLFKIVLKIMSVNAGVKKLDLTDDYVSFQFSEVHMKTPLGLIEVVSGNKNNSRLTNDNILKVRLTGGLPHAKMNQTKNILKEITRCVNS